MKRSKHLYIVSVKKHKKVNGSNFEFRCKHVTNQRLKAWFSLDQIITKIRNGEVLDGPLVNMSVDRLFNCKELSIHFEELGASIFEGFTSLTTLSLTNNQLVQLGNKLFEGLVSLTELNLSHNNLAQLDNKPFQGLTNLTELSLYSNASVSVRELSW